MPASQLKQLKASLREQGFTGPQKSKKEKRRKQGGNAHNAAKLNSIRDQFNPFEARAPSRSQKFPITNGYDGAGAVWRPGVTKGKGEENRRKTLLVEMRRRQKVGGVVDRRFGENDPTMTPEEKAMERFVREKQRGYKKASIFNLEGEDEDMQELSHLGKSLPLELNEERDDLDDSSLQDEAESQGDRRGAKRRKLLETARTEESPEDSDGATVRENPRTKQEVMKEVIAKSKLYKYERQKAKDDDDDLRHELDAGLADVFALMQGSTPAKQTNNPLKTEPRMNPDRAALLNGKDRAEADREYDERLREMAFDARSRPTTRTKTTEEVNFEAEEERKQQAGELLRRMEGDVSDHVYSDESDSNEFGADARTLNKIDTTAKANIPSSPPRELDVEDEDDFVLDQDLIASDLEDSDDGDDDENRDRDSLPSLEQQDAQKIDHWDGQGPEPPSSLHTMGAESQASLMSLGTDMVVDITMTSKCPQSHDELLELLKGVPQNRLPRAIENILASNHPRLHSENKTKLGVFAAILVEHLSHLAKQPERPSFNTLDSIVKHIHRLAMSLRGSVNHAFREYLKSVYEKRPKAFDSGDLVVFTAIGRIFSTSDFKHPIVTPANLIMGRYLAYRSLKKISDLAKGAYIASLMLDYQKLSKRYIPEVVNFVSISILMLSPVPFSKPFGYHPPREPVEHFRVGYHDNAKPHAQKVRFWDVEHAEGEDLSKDETLKAGLMDLNISLIDEMAEMWVEKSAFIEIFDTFAKALDHLMSKECAAKLLPSLNARIRNLQTKLSHLLAQAQISRKPLALHNHRPIPIKMQIPRFEESFDPDKHYDPDRERAELRKLHVEHKRERKGALRELRRDAAFVAREELREKKARDEAYEARYRRLVAEIQGEEGAEANRYEREKRIRKGKW